MSKQIRVTRTACAVPYVCLLLLVFALAAGAGPAHAQTSTNLPGVRILQGTLISVPLAESYYQSHAPLRGGVNSRTTSVTGYTRSPEVIALANGLGASQVVAGTLSPSTYAQRVNEYVYNNIAVEFMFGEQQGALGAVINQSGTPFDQANLLGELLKVAGISVTYNIGTITLTAAQFTAWTGISNPIAACRLLADGGIPGSINGSTPAGCDQATLGTTLSGVTMLHIWVSALGNLYDPSFKVYSASSGIDLAAAMGCGSASNPTCGSSATNAALASANTANLAGTTLGAIAGVNQTSLESTLSAWAMNLKTTLDQTNPNAALTDVIGGPLISAAGITTPSSTLPYGTPTADYSPTDIPDLFRTTLTVQFDSINQKLFVDEIAGQRLQLMGTTQGGDSTTTTRTMYLYLEFQLLASSVNSSGTTANAQLVLTANHPYAASNGTYMQDVYVTSPFIQGSYNNVQSCGPNYNTCTMNGSYFFIYRTTIINSWGYTGKAAIDRLRGIVKGNRYAVNLQGTSDLTAVTCLNNIYNPPQTLPYGVQGIQYGPGSNNVSLLGLPGCLQWGQAPLATQWLGEVSRASDLIDAINSTTILQHHILGTLESSEWDPLGNMTFDVSSNISAVTKLNTTADRRAAIMSYAMLSSRLEGGILEQTAAIFDGLSAVSLFARGNHQNEQYAQLNSPADWGNYGGSFANYSANNNFAASMVTTYLGAGDSLITPQNWFTPQQTICAEGDCSGEFALVPWPAPTLSIHPSAADATTPDRITLLVEGLFKGAGANGFSDPDNTALAAVTQQQDYSLKARKYYGVDAGTGIFRLLPPPDLVTGVGGAPYSLSLERYYESNKDGQAFGVNVPGPDASGINPPAYGVDDSASSASIGYGWDTNWSITATWTSDAFQGMGEDSPIDAVGAISALYVLRVLNSSSLTLNSDMTSLYVANWMGEQFDNNALLVSRPPATDTFIRLPDGKTFNAPPHGGEQLVISGSPTGPWVFPAGTPFYMDYGPITASLTEKDGSVLAFAATGGNYGAAVTLQPSTWSYPDGTVISFQYAPFEAEVPITNSLNVETLTQVSNNLGRSLQFSSCTYPCILQVTDDSGRSVSYTPTFPGGQAIPGEAPTSLAVKLPDGGITTYNYTSNSTQYNATRVNNLITSVVLPTSPNPFLTIGYDSLLRTATVEDAGSQTTTYAVSSLAQEVLHRSDVIDPLHADTTHYFDKWGDEVETIDPLNRVTTKQYDNRYRLQQTWLPEGNATSYTYDARSNPLTTTDIAEVGSGWNSIVTESLTYMEGPTVGNCVAPATCNRVHLHTDSLNATTTYTYNSNGQVSSISAPAVQVSASGPPVAPQVVYCYSGVGPLSLLTGKVSTADASNTRVVTFTYNTSNKYVLNSMTVDPSQSLTTSCAPTTKTTPAPLILTTNYSFDAVGNPASVTDPRTNLTRYTFDQQRRLTVVTPPTSTGAQTRYCYDLDGELISTNKAMTAGAADPNATSQSTTGQCTSTTLYATPAWQHLAKSYYPTGDLQSETDADGFVTQYGYDAVGRRNLTVDPDSRETANVYDLAGQLRCIWKGGATSTTAWALGEPSTGVPTDITCPWTPSSYSDGVPFRYAAYTYGSNGEQLTTTDADNNQTSDGYDAFVRLSKTTYPDTSSESFWYTTSGAVNGPLCGSASRKHCAEITRAGATVAFTYDVLDRLATKTPPDQGTTTYGYDLLGEPTLVSRAAMGSFAAHSTVYGYDAAGRKASESNDSFGAVSYGYDRSGNRSSTTWPDTYYVTYTYDPLNRMQYVYESGATELAYYSYDTLSRRNYLCLGGQSTACATNGGTGGTNRTNYGYDSNSYLTNLGQVLNTASVTWQFGRNNSGQVTTQDVSDSTYLQSQAAAGSATYVPNNLNEYTTAAGSAAQYDGNGNLTSWYQGGALQTYTYDSENKLVQAVNSATGTTTTYDYDGLGRRVSKNVGGTVTQYLLDGDEEIAELGSNGNILRRYITGPTTDDRIVHVEGTGSAAVKTYYHVNHQGSVVAMTDASGNLAQKIFYDEYGQSSSAGSGESFRFTGRRFDVETGLYYYRARYYSPQLGRFLQTDPIGYKDDLNLYAYGGDDPLDRTDPSGKSILEVGFLIADIVELGSAVSSGTGIGLAIANVAIDAVGVASPVPGISEAAHAIEGVAKVAEVGEKVAQVGEKAAEVGKVADEAKTVEKAATSGETAATKAGREAHKNWDPGEGFQKEVELPSGKRADAVNFKKKEVKELKPNNRRAVKRGEKQVEGYRKELQDLFPGDWTGTVETY